MNNKYFLSIILTIGFVGIALAPITNGVSLLVAIGMTTGVFIGLWVDWMDADW